MFNLEYILHSGFFEIRAWDLPNLAICWFVIVFFGLKYRVPSIYLLVLFFHTLIPFFLIGFLFDYTYMPDTIKYWEVFNLIRSGEMSFFDAFYDNVYSRTVSVSAAFYSLFPFPVAVSPISIGFYNVFIYLFIFFFSFNKGVFTKFSLWFYLAFPSLALYSSLSLRDMLIFFFMFFSFYFMLKNRFVFSFVLALPLFLIKFQNFFLLAVAFIFYLMFVFFDLQKRPVVVFICFMISFFAAQYIFPYIAPALNLYRRAMYVEDGGVGNAISPINSFYEFILEGVFAALRFLTKPLPHEASGFLQLIQSAENIFVLFAMFCVFRRIYALSSKLFLFWFVFLMASFVVYGLVVFNFGTAVRYRFSFVVMFFIFACHQMKILNEAKFK